ncbi:conserved hypothetical protein [Aster yellows witches'-broom phytoplasma AYWB]|uniref:Uncharacterized protein n=2 Tax=Aster yellows witches'-broom phytoplasma TaxID=229545 RepID=Q2NJW4_AYWBP|nr:conserved hypothetical protein [Aster yellows witches'-broom phytoplasma AYWB]
MRNLLMILEMIFSFNFLKYLISFDFKDFFYLLYDLFYNIFLTKSSFLFGFNVGWNINFINIYNIIKTIFIFIWEQLTTLIYPLKLFSSLFDFLMQILKIFIDVFGSIIGYIKSSITSLTGQKLMDPSESTWEKLKEIAKMIFTVTVGGSVIYFFKEVNSFLLNSFIKIGDLLFKIILRILDIISIVLKFFLFLFKKVIIILSFILSFFINFLYLWVFENAKKTL